VGELEPLVRWLGARALRWYYRERCVVRWGEVPREGPVLLVGNHPNDLPDVLLALATTARLVRFVATISAAGSWLARRTYEGLGVIPVARVRDARVLRRRGVDITAVNEAAVEAAADALIDGGLVGIFPEGGVQDLPHLGSVRQGVARMLARALDGGRVSAVTIVPFGLHYDAPRRWRSDVTVVVGRSVQVAAHPGTAPDLAALTTVIRGALLGVTRNAESFAEAESRAACIAAVAAAHPAAHVATHDPAHASRPASPPGSANTVTRAPAALLARAAQLHVASPAALLDAASAASLLLADAVAEAGGIATSPRDHARLLHAAGLDDVDAGWPAGPAWWAVAVLGPLGWALHAPVFLACARVARRLAHQRTEVVARALVPGLFLVVGWYVVLALIAGAVVVRATGALEGSRWGIGRLVPAAIVALAVLAVLPRLGDAAVAWRDGVAARRFRRTVRGWPAERRAALRAAGVALRALVPS
jgi:1-acyl-sn-glycerol-3-phosphate acyltransferase